MTYIKIHPQIIQFVTTLDVRDGGPSRHALEVNLGLNSLGFDARLIELRLGKLKTRNADSDFLARHPFPNRISNLGKMCMNLREFKLWLSAPIWVVHGYFGAWPLIVRAGGRIAGKRTVIVPHGSLTSYEQKRHRVGKSIFKRLVNIVQCDEDVHFFVASEIEKLEMQSFTKGGTVSVVGAGSVLQPVMPSRQLHDPLRLLAMARLVPKKRFDLAIEAVKLLREGGTDCTLVIAGTGSHRYTQYLKELVTQAGLSDFVDFAGLLQGSAKHDIFINSDIFLLPSEDENFGLTVAEACSYGLPVIVSRTVGSASNLDDFFCRFISELEAECLATEVKTLTSTNYQLRCEMAFAAARQFDWLIVAHRWAHTLSLKDKS